MLYSDFALHLAGYLTPCCFLPIIAPFHYTDSPNSPTVRPIMINNTAVIGKATTIRGDISGHEDLLVEGQVLGPISLPESTLTIGANGRVTADVHASIVRVDGRLEGNIWAKTQAVLGSSAHVVGRIIAPRVLFEDGCQYKGFIHTAAPKESDCSDLGTVRDHGSVEAPQRPDARSVRRPIAERRSSTSNAQVSRDMVSRVDKPMMRKPAVSVESTLTTTKPGSVDSAPVDQPARSRSNATDIVATSDLFGLTSAQLIVDPGKATPRVVGQFLSELSTLYRMMGGSGITFDVDHRNSQSTGGNGRG